MPNNGYYPSGHCKYSLRQILNVHGLVVTPDDSGPRAVAVIRPGDPPETVAGPVKITHLWDTLHETGHVGDAVAYLVENEVAPPTDDPDDTPPFHLVPAFIEFEEH